MQQMSQLPPLGKTAFRYGLIVGLPLALVMSVYKAGDALWAVSLSPSDASVAVIPEFLLGVLMFLIGLGAYFLAGTLAAKQNGRVATGTIAGLWTGVMYGAIGAVVSIIVFYTVQFDSLVAALERSTTSTSSLEGAKVLVAAGAVGGAIFGALFAVGVGAGMGALGGLLGKKLSGIVQPPQYPGYPPYAPPMPYPGYAQPYPAPGYPQPYPMPGYGQAYPAQVPPTQVAAPQQPVQPSASYEPAPTVQANPDLPYHDPAYYGSDNQGYGNQQIYEQ